MAAAYEGVKWFRISFQLWVNSQHRPATTTTQRSPNKGQFVSYKGLSSHAAEEALVEPSLGNGKEGAAVDEKNQSGKTSRQLSEEKVYAPTVTPALEQPPSRKFPSMW